MQTILALLLVAVLLGVAGYGVYRNAASRRTTPQEEGTRQGAGGEEEGHRGEDHTSL